MWDGITYPVSNFNGATVKGREWIKSFTPPFTMDVIVYPCWDWSLSLFVKGAPDSEMLLHRFGAILTHKLNNQALTFWIYPRKDKQTFAFSIVSQKWDGGSTWTPSLYKRGDLIIVYSHYCGCWCSEKNEPWHQQPWCWPSSPEIFCVKLIP